MKRSIKTFVLLVLVFCLGNLAYGQDDASATSLYNDGLAKLKAKEYAAALPLLEQALEKADPEKDAQVVKLAKRNAAFACYYVANGLRKEKKYDEALEIYEKGIGYSAAVYSNFVGKAQAIDGKGNDTAAVRAYITAAEMTRKAKKEDRADKLLKKAENYAAIAKSKKQWDKAIDCAAIFLESNESAASYYYLAEGQKGKKKYSDALASIDKALELAAEDKDKMYFSKAEILEGMGQKTKAVEAYKMVSGETYGERAKYKANQLSGGK